ncbi:50S ribosomal protein L30 [Bradymonas sediminis]|uniref:50S ribosomal protein L30 n=1 Tax=Bradymonas sediminis TaxID=1548548 RepID=A0A2Z4FGI8_9DELT|nr:50S ribosomal protein L30 [Bradymonas sediminis]AWV88000.1 50S ribosomal protein L30 [Bradymonas sediminis]TDP77123.1 LSU ribosomal protein L30P [Bradymonas sediminis]
MAQLKVELKRGLSGLTASQLGSVKGLGLRKRHQVVIIEDTPSIRGMINKVSHLVSVEELEG